MPSTNVKGLTETTREKLKDAVAQLEPFLNNHVLSGLIGEDGGEGAELFYRGLLSDLRHLLVYSEVAVEKTGVLLRRPNFDTEQGDRVLYEVYHHCVNAFFYPKNECYSEDGRYAYTGQDAIRFRYKPVRTARDIVLSVSKIYEELRDDLSYYESDYMTQRRMQGQK
ncbi:YpuI family protein [Paenibacillus sp. PAMC21692]|uniref:YpuI family protein n=1 Tax=Paenibacillus sp. PAMC21692 TaxID=2762320 RepID=UPI00164E7262|nr:YpuI family protein [Paenibacillus sp. PAMC21692]QNK55497.1 YpuI family protein [Paenibacillus sp. PAMC21692]